MFTMIHVLVNKNYTMAIISSVVIDLKSHAVMCAEQVLISWKQCKIETRLLTTDS